MKKDAFTLIETICSMAILTIVFCYLLGFSKPCIKVLRERKFEEIKVLTEDIFCFGKLRSKHVSQYTKVAITQNSINLYDSKGVFIRNYKLPKEYYFVYNSGKTSFLIDPDGEINISTTISAYKGNEKREIMSITAGSEYLNVK